MNFDMPKAVFCGLALIAAAIFFGPGSDPATARGHHTDVRLCDGDICLNLKQGIPVRVLNR